ncbi:DUF4317 family protein [Clostridium scatologenes]|uniref:Uncharacterized protein n=1 Tax=Clostridium scatologenes TaxID=1548 RepID=A0A0E3GQG4_CLOSL|nr:DUF4317 family protein [Clostridium scatologenes]AKA68526.1 hypothetical protein CSCA_1401 [Clostridium scatologenes]
MNKRDLADIRKEFKLGAYMLPIKEVYSVYLKKDNGEIIAKELNIFERMDTEKEELYLENFKKILTGTLDSKIFELNFKNKDTQDILYKALNDTGSINIYADKIVNMISENYTYDTDVVINFIKAEYYKAKKKDEEKEDDFVQAYDLILCTVNKVDLPKKALKLDYSDLTFKPNSALDMMINLKSPLDGFMFPSFSNGYVDADKIMYYSSKSKWLNNVFVEEVLGCKIKATAAEEKQIFDAILNTVIGDRIRPEIIQEIYENIMETLEDWDDEENKPSINMGRLKNILEFSGLSTEKVKSAFEELCGSDYEFRIMNIIPDMYSKSIKIENEYASISIEPKKLNTVKQIISQNGRKCLVLELNEDVQINGFMLESES